jgi:transcriptional regulator GlxA family with amidase domain
MIDALADAANRNRGATRMSPVQRVPLRAPADSVRIGIVIYDGVEPIDIGGTAGAISMAARVLPGISCVLIAERPGPVRLAGGITVLANAGFAAPPPCETYIVCGGPGWREQVTNTAMLSFLRSKARGELASVCTGALILAAAGTLDGVRATTRRSAVGAEAMSPLAQMTNFAATASPQTALVVDDQGVITSGGVSLAIDGTLYILGRIYGEPAREEVAKLIEYDRAFEANRRALGIVT